MIRLLKHLQLGAWLVILTLAGCGNHNGLSHESENSKSVQEHAKSAPTNQTTIVAEVADQAGVRTAPVGAGIIRDAHDLQGLLTTVEGRHANIHARFPGPVKSVAVRVGDHVEAGQQLAIVESNASLSTYAVAAPFRGTILNVTVGTGDLAADEPLFEVADLTSLWVDVHLFGGDAQHIAPGLSVRVTRLSDGAQISAKLDRILPSTATASQSTVARATIRNSDGQWRPGTAVRARVTVSEREASLIVPNSALQTFDRATVVFTRTGNVYTARPVRIGERDADNVEVLEGLTPGEAVVVAQSYLIKADLEKTSAANEH